MPSTATEHGVMTLPEAAQWLRVSDDVLRDEAERGRVPARKVGDEWRFLEAALKEWLSTPCKSSGRENLMRHAGRAKDDPYLNEIVREAYERRGRPITEDAE
jgi:excisionase family DNA binding protein